MLYSGLWWAEDSSNSQIVAFTFGRGPNATVFQLKKFLSVRVYQLRIGSQINGLHIRTA
jgi:hypothetical protein